MASEGLVCSQVRHSECPQGCVPFGFRLREPPTNTLIRLAELVLQKNFFSFNGSFYVQKSGVAMGSNLGRSFACLFVSYQEEKSFKVIKAPYLNFSNVLLMMV